MSAKQIINKLVEYVKDRFTKEFFTTYGGVLLALAYAFGWLTKGEFQTVARILEHTGIIAPGIASAVLILIPEKVPRLPKKYPPIVTGKRISKR